MRGRSTPGTLNRTLEPPSDCYAAVLEGRGSAKGGVHCFRFVPFSSNLFVVFFISFFVSVIFFSSFLFFILPSLNIFIPDNNIIIFILFNFICSLCPYFVFHFLLFVFRFFIFILFLLFSS
jgi:hypothetical protein